MPPDPPHSLWLGHRTFAVDGSKLNLPRPLVKSGYRTPSPTSYYPQGLLSCRTYRIPTRCLSGRGEIRPNSGLSGA